MMKTIYLSLLELLSAVPGIRYTDLDKGQLEHYSTRPAVAFPCALIKVEINRTENLGNNIQRCSGRVVLRLAFDYVGETARATNARTRAKSLAYFDLLQAVYLAVQGKEAAGNKFDRQSCAEENRADGLKVVQMPFAISWLDKSGVVYL